MKLGAVVGEATKDHPRQRRCFRQRIGNSVDRNGRRAVGRKTIDAGGDGGIRDRAKAVGLAKLEPTAVTRGKQLILALMATMPDRPDGVDHMFRGEPVALGDLGIARLAAMQCAAFGEQLGPGSTMDRAIDATAAEK